MTESEQELFVKEARQLIKEKRQIDKWFGVSFAVVFGCLLLVFIPVFAAMAWLLIFLLRL